MLSGSSLSRRRRTRLKPMKPAEPVTRMVLVILGMNTLGVTLIFPADFPSTDRTPALAFPIQEDRQSSGSRAHAYT